MAKVVPLETLVVSFAANNDNFLRGVNTVLRSLNLVVSRMEMVDKAAAGMTAGLQKYSVAIMLMTAEVEAMMVSAQSIVAANATAIGTVGQSIANLTSSLGGLDKGSRMFTNLEKLSSGILNLSIASATANPANLSLIATELTTFAAKMNDGSLKAILDKGTSFAGIGRLATSLRDADAALRDVSSVNFSKLGIVSTDLSSLGRLMNDPSWTNVANALKPVGLAKIAASVKEANALLVTVDAAPFTHLPRIGAGLLGFGALMDQQGMKNIMDTGKFAKLASLGKALQQFQIPPPSNFDGLTAFAANLKSFAAQVGAALTPKDTKQIAALGKVLKDLGTSLTGISAVLAPGINFTALTGAANQIRDFAADLNKGGTKNPVTALAGNAASYKGLREVANHLRTFSTAIKNINVASLGNLPAISKAITAFANSGISKVSFVNFMGNTQGIDNLKHLATVGQHLTAFAKSMSKIDASALPAMIKTMTALQIFARSGIATQSVLDLIKDPSQLRGLHIAKGGSIGAHLSKFVDSMASVDLKNVQKAIGVTSALRIFAQSGIDSKTMMKLVNAPAALSGLVGIGATLAKFAMEMDIVDLANVNKLTGVTSALASFAGIGAKRLGAVVASDLSNLPTIGTHLAGFINALSVAAPGPALTVLSTLGGDLSKFFRAMTTKSVITALANPNNFKNLPQIGADIGAFMKNLSSVNVNAANLTAIASAMQAAAMLNRSAARPPTPPRTSGILTGSLGSPSGAVHAGAFAASVDKFAFQVQLLRYGIAGFGIASAIAFARFDDALTRSLAMLKNSTPQMRAELQSLIMTMTMSGTTASGPTQLAQAFGNLAQAGISAADAMKQLIVIDRFVMVSQMDTAKAVEHLMVAMHNYRAKVSDIEHIGDVLVAASSEAKSSVEEMAIALSRVSGLSYAIGMSLEKTVAALTLLHRAGLKGSEAGTALARFLTTLTTAGSQNIAMWQKWQVDIKDASGAILPFEKILENLATRMQGMPQLEKMNMLIELGIGESGSTNINRAMEALIHDFNELNKLTKEYEDATGITFEKAAKIMQGFGMQMKMAWNALIAGLIHLAPIVTPMLIAIKSVLLFIVRIISLIPPGFKTFVGLLLIAIPLVMMVGKAMFFIGRHGGMLVFFAEELLALWRLIAIQMAGITVFGWIAIAAIGLAALVVQTEEGRKALTDIFNALMKIVTAIAPLFEPIAMMLVTMFDPLVRIAIPILQTLAVLLTVIANLLNNKVTRAFLIGTGFILLAARALWTYSAMLTLASLKNGVFGISLTFLKFQLLALNPVLALTNLWVWMITASTTVLAVKVAIIAGKFLLVAGVILILVDVIGRLLGLGSFLEWMGSQLGILNAAATGGSMSIPGAPTPAGSPNLGFRGEFKEIDTSKLHLGVGGLATTGSEPVRVNSPVANGLLGQIANNTAVNRPPVLGS